MTTSVTAAQIAQLRRMVAEPLTTTYSDALLTSYIETYVMVDELGTEPYYWTQTGSTPTQTANVNWIPTYDLNAAAADIWEEKAAALADDYDFAADGGNYSRSQAYRHAIDQAKHYKSKRGLTTIKLIKSPKENASGSINRDSYIGNLPEDDIFGNEVSFLEY